MASTGIDLSSFETTIVSAFISNVNTRNDRKTSDYIELGKKFLKIEVPKIIFMDDTIEIPKDCYDPKYTVIIPNNRDDVYLYKHLDKLTSFSPNTDNPAKDTPEFFMIMINKTRWMKKATEINPFSSTHFVWKDFGVQHIFHGNEDLYRRAVMHLCQQKYDKIRIGCIWNLETDYGTDLVKSIAWHFAGGVLGGNVVSILMFDELVEKKCMELIETQNTLTWEVNIWYMIYRDNKDLFSPYYCDHNPSLLLNY